jgi:hypothetical protein
MKTLHRSQNLVIARADGTTDLTFEVRFPTSVARGTLDAACPRCGGHGIPEQWEIEGPESKHNPVWLRCEAECKERDTRWTKGAEFDGDWLDVG